MQKYRVEWRYASSLGNFAAGDVVELDEDLAEHINRDSPGVLTRFVDVPKQNRRVTRKQTRAVNGG